MTPTPQHLYAQLFTSMPAQLRQVHPSFGRPYLGQSFDSYLEGARFDREGNLYVVDIPHSRVLRIDGAGRWLEICRYDGRPKGLEVERDGSLVLSDNVIGLMKVDRRTRSAEPLLTETSFGPLVACNDLAFTMSGDLLFTDQKKSSLANADGCVYRWRCGGRPEQLLANVPGPNGIVANLDESQIFVSATRANAVWNLQLDETGAVARVGVFANMPGGFGPDGLALDAEGGLVVAQPGIGVFRFSSRGRCTHFIELPGEGLSTTAAFAPDGSPTLFITDAQSGSIYTATMPFPGNKTYALA